MTLHKHGEAWCLNPACISRGCLTKGDEKLLKEFRSIASWKGPAINLHYHDGLPCTGRFCRKRGTPKVDPVEARLVLGQAPAMAWVHRFPLVRCPRCKMHLGRMDFAGNRMRIDSHLQDAHGAKVHWCCPDSCELQQIRQCKELDAAVITAAVERRPFVPVYEQWDLAQEIADRAVPFRVFYVKLGRLHPRIHGCYHTTRSFCSGRFHLNSQCQGGC